MTNPAIASFNRTIAAESSIEATAQKAAELLADGPDPENKGLRSYLASDVEPILKAVSAWERMPPGLSEHEALCQANARVRVLERALANALADYDEGKWFAYIEPTSATRPGHIFLGAVSIGWAPTPVAGLFTAWREAVAINEAMPADADDEATAQWDEVVRPLVREIMEAPTLSANDFAAKVIVDTYDGRFALRSDDGALSPALAEAHALCGMDGAL